MPTKEDYGQGQVDEVANFRTYDTVDANIKGYINFLNTGNYDKALNAKSDMEYLQELKNAGYATDQDYVTTVGSVYKRNLESGTFD
jgi:flagellum-specific peptidoglycan hydrolase FlgJ